MKMICVIIALEIQQMIIMTNHYGMDSGFVHVSDARMQVKIELNAVHNTMSCNNLRYIIISKLFYL